MGVHWLRVPAVWLADCDLSGLEGTKSRGAVSTRDSEYPVHVVQHVRLAHVESRHGTRAGGGATRRHEAGQTVAAGHGAAGPRVSGRPVLGIQTPFTRGDRTHHEPAR